MPAGNHEEITQDNRLLAVYTTIAQDTLLLNSFSGSEGVSRPFRFTLKLVADVQNGKNTQVVAHNLVGKSMTIRIKLSEADSQGDTGERYITGLCERFSTEDIDDEFQHYTAVIVPWFSFFNYASNCRIFQDKAVPDVIQEVVSDLGYSGKLRLELTKTYTVWDYCVQYRETDFNFISRLMEAEGIYYYFEHTNGDHTMVLADSTNYKTLPKQSSFRYSPVTGVAPLEDTVRRWRAEEEIHPGKWTIRDFHHEMPHNHLEQHETSPVVCDEGHKYEVYDYPGDFAKKFNKPESRLGQVSPEGEKIDRLRMEKEETYHVVFSGTSRCRAFCSGYKVTITGGEAAGTYEISEVEHSSVQQPAYRMRDSVHFAYENRFRMIDSSVLYVPPLRSPKPVVYGLQTAFVIDESPSGNTEEIWPDKYGRVRVRFHWDREAKYACWLRVVQGWAGKMWGHQWIPRIGDEVAVQYQEGDPDVPYVIGSLYNKENMPMFTLPDNKTQSGIHTHSSKNGGSSDYNMLRYEDLKGSEEIYVQAQKDYNALIKHDETRKVKNDRTSTIHVNDSRTVETGDDTIQVQQGSRTITVSQGNISETASLGTITVTAGASSITIQAATTITIQANAEITLQCGGSTISMTPANISISSPMVLINS